MTITVTPGLPPTTSQASFSGAGGAEAPLEAGTFAGLLLSQMQTSNPELAFKPNSGSSTQITPSEGKKEAADEDEEAIGVSDPSVLAMLAQGMQQAQPTPANTDKFSLEQNPPPVIGAINSTVTSVHVGQAFTSSAEAETISGGLTLSTTDNKSAPETAADFAAPQSSPEFSANSASSAMPHSTLVPKEQPTEISSPIHSEKWPAQFGEKLVWLAKNEVQTAQINIAPPQLGPIQINLTLTGDQATAIFASPHAEVRQAIEDAMPQLKEMLSSAGINLGQSDVGSNMTQQQTFSNGSQGSQSPKNTDENAILPGNNLMSDISPSTSIRRGNGMVDLFA
ncbi:flagellar hook-length control protein FliK [Azonexus sp. IMCC34839]|uniref:flagellar hook-length control protein FliK n=1 Tax=Azonexus sp. IMCC34839 TaxID=3133695 RepID=UPI00399B0098